MSNQRTYSRDTSAVFCRLGERHGFFSNFMPVDGLWVNGKKLRTAEHLYQICRFPHLPEVQLAVANEWNPKQAKDKAYENLEHTRADWWLIRVSVMRFVLRAKFAAAYNEFASELTRTGDLPIVEQSSRDEFWGARPGPDGQLHGRNVLGRLLMEIRRDFLADRDSFLVAIPPEGLNLRFWGQQAEEVHGVRQGSFRL